MKYYFNYFSSVLVLIAFIAISLPMSVNAQRYPVKVAPQVIPPYSLKLAEYNTSFTDKVIVNLLLSDISKLNVEVRLKFYLENNTGLSVQSTDLVVGANPVFLDGGVPLRLTSLDLQAYFAIQNLQGISPQQYNLPLPEGLYRFCFEVYDAQSGKQLSRKSCAIAYLVLNDPPFLNIPNKNEQIVVREPQNIIFQWTPRHINATNVEYEFTLSELWDTNMDPQASFLASRPLYQTNTHATTLLYGPGETSLIENKMYGWRVRAIVTDGISETSVFKNNGYSEIYHFTYSKNCEEPQFVLAEAISPTSEKIMWQGIDHKQYIVQYRKKSPSPSSSPKRNGQGAWFEGGTFNEYIAIHKLLPGTNYQFRVGGQCMDNGPYTYSQIYEFMTPLKMENTTVYNCGMTPEIIINNQEPLAALVINETFIVGDFPVTVKEVYGGNGSFSGWGYIIVPYLQDTRIKVSFDNIKINTDYQLTEGIVVTDYDENWGGVRDVGKEIEKLLSLGDAIIEALNLDIDKDTKDKIKHIVESITNNIKDEDLPDTIKEDIIEASENLENAKEEYDTAKEEYKNASTPEEKEVAKEEMNEAQSEFSDAQNNLQEANENVEEFKEKTTNLLKKAIYELYREGRDQEDQLFSTVENKAENFESVIFSENVNNVGYLEDDVDIVFISDSHTTSSLAQEFYDEEIKLGVYLFAKLLSQENVNEKALEGFIKEAKSFSINIITIIEKGISEGKKDNEIIEELKRELKTVFVNILVKYSYQ